MYLFIISILFFLFGLKDFIQFLIYHETFNFICAIMKIGISIYCIVVASSRIVS